MSTPVRTGIVTPALMQDSRTSTPFRAGIATTVPTQETGPSTPDQTGIITPAPTPPTTSLSMPTSILASGGASLQNGMLYLNQWQMNDLIARGIKAAEPQNGPNEGDPVYQVPATPETLAAIALIGRNAQASSEADELIDPSLRIPAPRRSAQRRSRQ